jgi:thiol-disulfide isomerase/thioredoxin
MKTRRIILVVVLLLIVGSIYYLESLKVSPAGPVTELETKIVDSVGTGELETEELETEGSEIKEEIKKKEMPKQPMIKDGIYPLAPELKGLVGYINTEEGTQISDFRGKVVLIDFWTYSCINCIRTLPHLTSWDQKYKDKGLVIIGVHTPEFEFEKDIDNVKSAMEKYGIEYIVVQDNNYVTWRNFKNRFWPRKFLIDSEGYVRFDHIGEGAYDQTEKVIQLLLDEAGMNIEDVTLSEMPDETPKLPTTPELYAGYDFALPRGQNVGNYDGLNPNDVVNYVLPEETDRDVIYLEGEWHSNADNLEAKEDSALIVLDFLAGSVNIVANNLQEPVEMEVFINDKYISKEQAGNDVKFDGLRAFVVVDQPQLYNVFEGDYDKYTLKLVVKEGFTFNAFTFG